MNGSTWELLDTPFAGRPSPGDFFASAAHDEVLARLQFLVDQQRQVGLMVGPEGTGKTYLLAVLADHCRRDGAAVAQVNLIGVAAEEFPALLADGLGLHVRAGTSAVGLWQQLADHLIAERYQRRRTVVLLDDIDQAAAGVGSLAARLAALEPARAPRVTLVATCRPEGWQRVPAQLAVLAELRIELTCWEPSDTADFLAGALRRANLAADFFDPGAIGRLHELSRGVPRRVCRLADLALLAAAGQQAARIDAEMVEAAQEHLGVAQDRV